MRACSATLRYLKRDILPVTMAHFSVILMTHIASFSRPHLNVCSPDVLYHQVGDQIRLILFLNAHETFRNRFSSVLYYGKARLW